MHKSNWNPYPKYLQENARYGFSYVGGKPMLVQLVKVTEKGYNFKVLKATKKYGEGQMLFKKHFYPAKHYTPKLDEILFFIHNGQASTFTELESEATVESFATSLHLANAALDRKLHINDRIAMMNRTIHKLNIQHQTNFRINIQPDANDSIEYDFDITFLNTFLLCQYLTSLSKK